MTEQTTDAELIESANNGNAHAFSTLVERHYMTIYKMAYKYLGNQSEAEDVTQEACIKLARSLDSYRFDAAFTTWLYRLVINTAKDYIKKNSRTHKNEKPIYEDTLCIAAPDDQEQSAIQREVLNTVAELPEKLRDVVILVCWQGLSHKEAGDVLDINENTVSWRLHEVRKIMNAQHGREADHG